MRFSALLTLGFISLVNADVGVNPSECASLTTCQDCITNGCKWCKAEGQTEPSCTAICASPINKCSSAYGMTVVAGIAASLLATSLLM